ncbi:MAG TPA: ATP-binding protein [Acidimicrobiales bacterium]|nr:ATP-binding protein [Acidimicrobiales bacterium]
MEIDIALCLPREAETVGIVRDVAVISLVRLGVTRACAEDIRLALSEACTNVVDHSDADDEYEVRLQVDGKRCEVRVIDTGRGFDATSLGADPVRSDSPRGRGIGLMHALVDAINFTSEPEAGTIVHLVKTLEVEPGSPLDRLTSPTETQ